MENFEINYCIECGKQIIGRTDKKFCSLTCKNRHNNKKIREIKEKRIKIINKISRNYEILETLLDERRSNFSLEELSKLGFDHNYITGVRHMGYRSQIYLCFDIAYSCSGSKISKIKRVDLTTL